MSALQRVTTEFIEMEDRMRISGENEQGEVTSFWLTQRLLIRLVAHLVASLEKGAPKGGKLQGHDERISEMVQGMAQQAAQAALNSEEIPVKDPDYEHTWLALEVDIKHIDEQLHIEFRNKSGVSAEVTLEVSHLRQWLSILYRLWIQAEWPKAIWPQWMTDSIAETANQPSAPLH